MSDIVIISWWRFSTILL